MGTKRDSRQQKKSEKRRKTREKVRAERGSRHTVQPLGGGGGGALAKAIEWPLGDAWIGGDWTRHGTALRVVFSRQRDDGRIAAAFFDVTLADAGVTQASARADLFEDTFLGMLGVRSEEDDPMMQVEPELVVKLVEDAVAWQEDHGHKPPAAWKKAAPLLQGVDTSAIHDTFPFADPDAAPTDAPPADDGLLARLKKMVTG